MGVWVAHPNDCQSASLHCMDLLFQTSVRSVSSTSPVGLSVSRNIEVGACGSNCSPSHCCWLQDGHCYSSLPFSIHPESLHSQLLPPLILGAFLGHTLISWGIFGEARSLRLASLLLSIHGHEWSKKPQEAPKSFWVPHLSTTSGDLPFDQTQLSLPTWQLLLSSREQLELTVCENTIVFLVPDLYLWKAQISGDKKYKGAQWVTVKDDKGPLHLPIPQFQIPHILPAGDTMPPRHNLGILSEWGNPLPRAWSPGLNSRQQLWTEWCVLRPVNGVSQATPDLLCHEDFPWWMLSCVCGIPCL